MQKMLMLYNPCSGDGRIQGSLSELVDELTKDGYLVTVYPTQSAGDAESMIEKHGHLYDRIVVCGGDGMMHEAINGWIHGHDLPILGYVPSGTVHDFANTHDIPREILSAAKVAAGDSWTYLDVGQFNDEYFSYVAAFGVGTSVSYKTPQEKKKILGPTAYILEALNTVDFAHWENNCETMKISWQDNECEGDFLYGMVSNSRYVAGTDVFTKDLFNWHDGLLEGLFIRRPMNLIELNAIIAGITRSDFSNPLFIQVQSPWFDFECKQAAWTLDGEFGGKHDHVVARAVPKALKMALSQNYIQSEGSSLVRHVGPEGSTSGSKYLAEEPKEHKALRSFWKDPDEYHPVKTETDKVRMMTIHTAKGLEFDCVFLIGLNEGMFPSRQTRNLEGMEEERRLCFVALTRAKKELYLSEAQGVLHSGSNRYPSRFVFDIGLENAKWDPPIPKDLQQAAKRMINLKKSLLPQNKQSDALEAGDLVEHPVFGQGTILEIDPEKQAIVVQFDKLNTRRTLSTRVRLKKLDRPADQKTGWLN